MRKNNKHMKKLILIICIAFVGCSGYGQRGFSMVAKDFHLDEYQKFIKDTICNDCVYENDKGYIPTVYSWVEYNYGEPPPDYMEIVKSYFTHGFPDTIRGWIIKDTLGFSFGGDCAYMSVDLIQTCTNKINSLLPMYIQRMSIHIPGCGGDDTFSINIWTPEDEMKRRKKLIEQ